MRRTARKKNTSGIYHVMLRGINRQTIFEDDEDCEKYLQTNEPSPRLDISLIIPGMALLAPVVGALVGLFGNVAEQLLNGTPLDEINMKSALISAGIGGGLNHVSFGLAKMVAGAYNLTPVGTTIIQKLGSCLRQAGLSDTLISMWFTTVFVGIPQVVFTTAMNSPLPEK